MGKKGQLVALEVNMRPCGGFTPDMINFARSTNVYKIWADMIAFGGTDMPVGEHYYCPLQAAAMAKTLCTAMSRSCRSTRRICGWWTASPEALSGAMGNQMYVATFSTREGMEQFYSDVLAVTDENKRRCAEGAEQHSGSGRAGDHPAEKPAAPAAKKATHHKEKVRITLKQPRNGICRPGAVVILQKNGHPF